MKIAVPALLRNYLSLVILGAGGLLIGVFYLGWVGASYSDPVTVNQGEVVGGGVTELKSKTRQALLEVNGWWQRRNEIPGENGIAAWEKARDQMLKDEKEVARFLEERSAPFRQWFKELLPLPAGRDTPQPMEFKGAYEDYFARLQSSYLRRLLPAQDLLLKNKVLFLTPPGKREEDLTRPQKEYWIVEAVLQLMTSPPFLDKQESVIRLKELGFSAVGQGAPVPECPVGPLKLVPWLVRCVFLAPASRVGELAIRVGNGLDPEHPWLVEIRGLDLEKQAELAGEEYHSLSFPVKKNITTEEKERDLDRYLKESDYPPLVKVRMEFVVWEAVTAAPVDAVAPPGVTP